MVSNLEYAQHQLAVAAAIRNGIAFTPVTFDGYSLHRLGIFRLIPDILFGSRPFYTLVNFYSNL